MNKVKLWALLGVLWFVVGCNPGASYVGQEDSAASGIDENAASSSGSLIFCPVIERRVTQADCDDLRETEKAAKVGTAAFNAPSTIERGKAVTIQLAISLAAPVAASNSVGEENATNAAASDGNNAAGVPDNEAAQKKVFHSKTIVPVESVQKPEDVVKTMPGTVESYNPIVGKYMIAQLVGDGFAIDPPTPVEHELVDGGVTTWEWKVTPLEKGPHTLTLTTTVEGVTSDGKKYPLKSTTRNQVITVKLTLWQSILDFLTAVPAVLKIITAALASVTALVLGIWAFRRALKGKTEKDEKGEGPSKGE